MFSDVIHCSLEPITGAGRPCVVSELTPYRALALPISLSWLMPWWVYVESTPQTTRPQNFKTTQLNLCGSGEPGLSSLVLSPQSNPGASPGWRIGE